VRSTQAAWGAGVTDGAAVAIAVGGARAHVVARRERLVSLRRGSVHARASRSRLAPISDDIRRSSMNKHELVEQVAGRASLSRGQAPGAVEAALAAIESELGRRRRRHHGLRALFGRRARRPPGQKPVHRRAGRRPGRPRPRFAAGSQLKRAVAAS
jgi:nucleoid DNA-binding protein